MQCRGLESFVRRVNLRRVSLNLLFSLRCLVPLFQSLQTQRTYNTVSPWGTPLQPTGSDTHIRHAFAIVDRRLPLPLLPYVPLPYTPADRQRALQRWILTSHGPSKSPTSLCRCLHTKWAPQ